MLERKVTVADVAAVHVDALDAQIRILRLRRAVLSTVARRRSGTEEPQPVAALRFCSRVRCCGGCAQRIRAVTAGARARRRRRAGH
ncbi:hypothetical protein GCM10009530_07310 [Microbispora corallina]|uniref:Uncharacterized protein n=1 Tax=Microbispora corallina TaxID=83302 RepID=A0ABQ4FV49_9ACTN|nr:hypothetical protein Mco01_16940 [Microbispora corallina]